MNFLKSFINKLIMWGMNAIPFLKQCVFNIVINNAKNNQQDLNRILSGLSSKLIMENEKYPSAFNNGYLHIQKAIDFVNYFKLDKRNAVIDVGAASGIVSKLLFKAFPNATIYAFEPIPGTFELLKKESQGCSGIEIRNMALGNDVKSLDIHLAARITSSSLLDIKKNLDNDFWAKNLKEEGVVSVSMSKLDLEIPADKMVNILKMDVQGFELEVLRGAVQTLIRTAIVLVEMQNHDLYVGAPRYYDIDLFLRDQSFELYDMIPSIRQDRKIYEWDAIYVNKSIKK